MDELVYLFELDSVRNSTEEIRRAQWALFRETVLKGNRVVLSFNQLTDSEGFLWAVRDPESYRTMLSLFSMGVLKYSRFLPGGDPGQWNFSKELVTAVSAVGGQIVCKDLEDAIGICMMLPLGGEEGG